ncbi:MULTISPECIES: cytochrome d ubiquinol oxidase subunit II [Brevibacterium]|uniref:Cytochrome d ubiquinol oxidase subunit II n=1 Tax=Brevibacterium luteolum TaxID=199591 RepID=A0A849AXK5_9MICO|nr:MULTISPECIES: cytochrome d ubiquinol oxidase subunit II [Brevibacterium]MBM7528431.1 cytochrome d ubiquinol oxidase subunit II [Brevibacterium luteolum]MCT1828985.1 cytochrome d ubiquinol oxidase subunit II [Brevibacterium luteolum]MCT1873023.1 cytochrome d ubiquinol oxidase subunit II [Brevibacterium luteolum]MCT1890487.1 cytochrome d ubiquinol oxidase subunit II [Brevibacterium luteolum]MCT1891964.1 cytochrome d ubiquinol oxidase subunit II [Brevibacterium luteolum]
MDLLPTIWFILIAVLWLGYLFLEGFDLGVGMLLKGFSRDEKERRVLLNTIGPVWDGNEVWLLTAGGATFAAFPMWYASLFSALYLPLTLALLALILRAVAIEYRGKVHTEAWRNGWTWCLSGGSALAAFCVGAMLALTTTGLPLNENGDNIGGAFAWVNIYAIIGGLGVVGFCLLHGLLFISLKTDGEVRFRARALAAKLAPVFLLPLVAWVIIVQVMHGGLLGWVLIVVAAAMAALMWVQIRRGSEKSAFFAQSLFLAVGVTTVFLAIYPKVLPSTVDDSFSLTVSNASSSGYTLTVMLIVAIVFVPIVLAYQIWSYSVFAKRLKTEHIPPAHQVPVAIRSHHQ